MSRFVSGHLICLWLLTASVLSAEPPAVPGPQVECSSLQQLDFDTANSSSEEVLVNGTLAPGCEQMFWIAGNACEPSSNLMVELWDLEEVALSASEAFTSSPRAQPFLVAARGSTPLGYYNASSSTWTFLPTGSLTDVEGQDLMRPYLEVQTTFGSMSGTQGGSNSPGCTSDTPCWYVLVLNSQMLMAHELEYQLRVTCSATPQCPAPIWGGSPDATEPCSGRGRCQVALVPPPSDAVCDCQPGWGDIGCNQQLIELNNGEEVFESLLPPGQWEYYEVVLPDGDGTLLVEMSRTRGDPILFLKGFDEGFQVTNDVCWQPGALPSTLDYSTYADQDSWRERLDTASLLRTNASPGAYYVGIFNNNDDIQEVANYSLMARWSDGQRTPLCPWDCNGRGRCALSGLCICNSGFGGEYCEGTQDAMQFAQSFIGVLQPGAWAYYTLDLTSSESRDKPLTVEFDNNAGQSIVLGSFDSYPTLLDTNFTFRAGQMVGSLAQVLQPTALEAGTLIIGIYDMDYYVHSSFQYHLQVSQQSSNSDENSYTPWISVGVALGCTGIVGFLIFHFHRAHLRRRAGARGLAMWSWSALPVIQPPVRRRRTERRRGLDPALVHGFPLYTHDASKLARGESQTPKTDVPSEDEKLCSVCLCNYEDGDLIRQLLPCRHDFHCKCIDQWLGKNSTCPMCRLSLIPDGYVPSIERESVGGGVTIDPADGDVLAPSTAEQQADIQMAQMERGAQGQGQAEEEERHPRGQEPEDVSMSSFTETVQGSGSSQQGLWRESATDQPKRQQAMATDAEQHEVSLALADRPSGRPPAEQPGQVGDTDAEARQHVSNICARD